MKKITAAVLLGGLLFFGAGTSARAQGRPVMIFANFGLMLNAFIIPNEFTLGVQADVFLAKFIMVSPELSVWSNHFHFSNVTWAPGAILNIYLGGFYFGGGFSAMYGGGYGGFDAQDNSWALRPKFNIGARAGHFKLAISGTPFDDGVAGVITAGYGF